MNIDALVFDLDGTAIPQQIDGMPSRRVIEAVIRAKKYCHVSVATGRPYKLIKKILAALTIDDLCIVNGGASLYSGKTHEYVWKQEIDLFSLQEAFSRLTEYSSYEVDDDMLGGRVPLGQYKPLHAPCLVAIFAVPEVEAKKIISIVESIDGLVAHMMGSWTPGKRDIHITHELATKKHALGALLARFGVHHDRVMVVGDGGNDLPLFSLAGIKVAMGNASPELKAKADWIAPSVDDDGLAVAIEKYILPHNG